MAAPTGGASPAEDKMMKLLKWGFRLLLAFCVVMTIVTCVNISAVWNALPGIGGSDSPGVPSATQAVMDEATNSPAGQLLRHQGFTASAIIDDQGLKTWLDGLQKSNKDAKADNPGPYVIFSFGQPKPAKPEPGAIPDVVMDANYGVMIAFYQTYTNRRGAACYGSDLRTLRPAWTAINIYLWDKNLDEDFTLSQDQVPQIPSGVDAVRCHTFVS